MSTDITIANRRNAVALSGGTYEPVAQLKNGLRQGMMITAVLVLGLGGMAATLPMAGAVIAPGAVSVSTFVKQISHPTGGVVSEILVSDGMQVKEGQILVKLDDAVTGASATYTGENVDQLLARAARLIAERDNRAAIAFPKELTSRSSDPIVAQLMRSEQLAFQLRRQSRGGMVSQLSKRIAETQAEIAGYNAQADSYIRQAKLIDDELKVTRELYEQRFTTLDRLNALERSAVSLLANADSARTSANAAQARIAQLQAQASSVGQDSQSTSSSELLDVQSRISELRRIKAGADDSFERSVLRAPQSGVVDKLAIRTIGGVIAPGAPILEIVPDKDRLVVDAQIAITDADQVRVGQKAALRFSAFSMRTTPEIEGKVAFVSANRTVEEATGMAYFRVRIDIPPAELSKLGSLKLKPGMPVETFIQTGNRTMLNYLIKPLSDQLMRAFREG